MINAGGTMDMSTRARQTGWFWTALSRTGAWASLLVGLAAVSAVAAPPAQPKNLAFGLPSPVGSGGRSAGCGKTPPAGPNPLTLHMTLPVWGTNPQLKTDAQRDYEVMTPTSYDPNKPLPVTFVFHEYGGSMGGAVGFGLQEAAGARENGIFIFPQGLLPPRYGNVGPGWDEPCNGYDMPFVQAMLAQVEGDYCVDTNRVFATGFSWGGDMANSVGWCLGDAFRAVAPASGGEIVSGGSTSAGSAAKAAYRLTYDPGDPNYSFGGVLNLYRNAHGCSAASDDTDISNPGGPTGVCKAYTGCAAGAPVIACVYSGLGHGIPQPGWKDDVWRFFSGFQ
jgi:poly(3-hydroxybutyrate) depolymerase